MIERHTVKVLTVHGDAFHFFGWQMYSLDSNFHVCASDKGAGGTVSNVFSYNAVVSQVSNP